METSSVISTALFVLSIQMAVFLWMWVFSTDRQKSLAQLYVGSWKKLGTALWKFSFAPFFEPKK